jgi:hypothetical protein
VDAGAALLILSILLIAAFLIWLKFSIDRKRREEFMLVAARLGLAYERDDPFDTVDLPFALFSRGEGRGTENVLHGTAAGMKVRLFDYWYYEEVHNPKGPNTRSYHRSSCALGWFDADCPHLSLAREGFLSRIADKIGFRDIEFESEEFNRAWQVVGEDRRFAYAFVDARMMEWLLDEGDVCSYEVVGPLLLCSTDRLKPAEFETLFEVLRRFRSKVPDVVASLYPNARSAEA